MCIVYIEPRKKEGKNGSTRYSSNKRVTHQQKMGCEICFPPFFGCFGVALAPSSYYYPGTAAGLHSAKNGATKAKIILRRLQILCALSTGNGVEKWPVFSSWLLYGNVVVERPLDM